jgi:DNA replication ATP-dependent helicase Dna2
MGLENSLFSHLENDENVIPLTLQYRMNDDIQAMANFLTYNNQLECGSEQVAKRTLLAFDDMNTNNETWMSKIVDTNIETSVIFVDTTGLGPMERQDDAGICNDVEAEIVVQIYDRLKKLSTSSDRHTSPTIGVIAPYRSQVSNLRKCLSKLVDDPSTVNTVDQFQGRDQDVIIYSCTRCRPKIVDEKATNEKSIDILSDRRRLNVAVTRAKVRFCFKSYVLIKVMESLYFIRLVFDWIKADEDTSHKI